MTETVAKRSQAFCMLKPSLSSGLKNANDQLDQIQKSLEVGTAPSGTLRSVSRINMGMTMSVPGSASRVVRLCQFQHCMK